MEIKWTTTISSVDLYKWATKKCRNWESFQEEILKESDKTILKDYICDEVDKEITKVESYSYYMEYDTYLVKYSKE